MAANTLKIKFNSRIAEKTCLVTKFRELKTYMLKEKTCINLSSRTLTQGPLTQKTSCEMRSPLPPQYIEPILAWK